MASSMQSLLAIVLLTLYVLTFVFPIFVSSQDIGNGFCDAANLDCTDHGQTVELKITVNKGSHFTGVPVDGSDDDNMKDCTDVYNSGQRQSGVYSIRPTQLSKPIQVYCDLIEDGGGWTRLLLRQDGSVNFAQRWGIYKKGFGNTDGEHWIGNDNMAALTRQRLYKLRIRLWSFQNETRYADYASFVVEPEWDKYRLHIGEYSGDAGDSFSYQNNQQFSTIDADNDAHSTHCAQVYSAGNWFYTCYRAGLTNLYSHVPDLEKTWGGIVWEKWLGSRVGMKIVDMKIRPIDF